MDRRRAEDEKVEALRAIFAQDIPHTDDWTPPPRDDIEVEPPPTVTLSAVGGRSVVVDEADFLALLDAAGLAPTPDYTRSDLGRLLGQAKQGHPLLSALLTVRSDLAPLYRVRTAAGRPWRPTLASTITN